MIKDSGGPIRRKILKTGAAAASWCRRAAHARATGRGRKAMSFYEKATSASTTGVGRESRAADRRRRFELDDRRSQ